MMTKRQKQQQNDENDDFLRKDYRFFCRCPQHGYPAAKAITRAFVKVATYNKHSWQTARK